MIFIRLSAIADDINTWPPSCFLCMVVKWVVGGGDDDDDDEEVVDDDVDNLVVGR